MLYSLVHIPTEVSVLTISLTVVQDRYDTRNISYGRSQDINMYKHCHVARTATRLYIAALTLVLLTRTYGKH